MELILLIKEIEKRPALYLSCRSIHCLKSFLDGWLLGNDSGSFTAKSLSEWENVKTDIITVNSNYEIINKFQNYIQKKYNTFTTQSWSNIIFFYSQDEFDALFVFFKEFSEFLDIL